MNRRSDYDGYRPYKSLPPVKALDFEPQVIISQKFQNQVAEICKKNSPVEWSGVMFYTVKGEPGKPGFTCTCEEIFLMDIGTAGYTEYEFGPDVIKYIMARPELLKMSKGHCHSHNNMGVFFSMTDQSEIHENSEKHNLYLSLIVNNRNEMVAKICFRGKQKSAKFEFKNDKGENQLLETEVESDYIFEWQCNIEKPEAITQEMLEGIPERIAELKGGKRSWKKRSYGYSEFSGGSNWDRNRDTDSDEYDDKDVRKEMKDFIRGMLRGKSWDTIKGSVEHYVGRGSGPIQDMASDFQKHWKKVYKAAFPEDKTFENFHTIFEESLEVIKKASDDTYPFSTGEIVRSLKQNFKQKENGKPAVTPGA